MRFRHDNNKNKVLTTLKNYERMKKKAMDRLVMNKVKQDLKKLVSFNSQEKMDNHGEMKSRCKYHL